MYKRFSLVKLFYLVVSMVLLTSCGANVDHSTVTYIGGQIVNPKGDYVLLYKNEQVIDSIKLNDDNFFMYETEDLEKGLYAFKHYEIQVFYIEPGDSLMLRVNTIDFDESLSYSGTGAAQNNFLMDMFLMNEVEMDSLPKSYLLSPKAFEKRMDSFKLLRTKVHEAYLKKNNTKDEAFDEVAAGSINYDYYSKKELYASVNQYKKDSVFQKEFSEGFFDYRKEIDFGSEMLRSYFPYYRFLNRYFDNITINQNKIENKYYNRKSFLHSYSKVKTIDSLVTNESLKNNLVRSIVYRYLLDCNNFEKQSKMLELFSDVNNNPYHHEVINDLAKASLKLTKGNKIPNLFLVTPEKTIKDLHSVISQPTVFYFWSTKSIGHNKEVHGKAAELTKKFPNYSFIGINTDTHHLDWINALNKLGYNRSIEYQFDNIKDAEKKLVITSINKAIVVDKKGAILEGNTNLFNINIEKILMKHNK